MPKAHDTRPATSLQSAVHSSASGILLSCSVKNEMRLFSFAGKQLASVDASGLHNHMAAVSGNGRFLAAATFTSDVKVSSIVNSWDVASHNNQAHVDASVYMGIPFDTGMSHRASSVKGAVTGIQGQHENTTPYNTGRYAAGS